MPYTVDICNKMYKDWRDSGTDKEFDKYWGLTFQDLAEITKIYAEDREKKDNR